MRELGIENLDNKADTITIHLSDGDFTSSQPNLNFDETYLGSSFNFSSPIV